VSLLGQNTPVPEKYAPELLFPIARSEGREQLGLSGDLPFQGEDIWHAWELAWLDADGSPRVAVARLAVPADSPWLIESKSLKLYLNSLNNAPFESRASLVQTLETDLGKVAQAPIRVQILDIAAPELAPTDLPGECIDGEPLPAIPGAPSAEMLQHAPCQGEQVLHSHILRSLCPVTAQPDWASLVVWIRGVGIVPSSLLGYLRAFRFHQEFHEQCVERIFCDIQKACQPQALSVQALYTRRGGLDINPWRSTEGATAPRMRTPRQ
jgi:7-cyano-7-deazaguanine reductase